jgi:tyrosyl-tRNA synthetase
MSLINELAWRGLIQDIMPGTKEILENERVTGYIGFDPTSDSLHIGNLVPILLLMHLQRAGHKPIALVGGATGMVGDPSGKSEERNLMDEVTLNHNLAGIKGQLTKFLDFDPGNSNAAEMVNNFDWFRNMHFLQFIRDVGKHITVNYMMAKDSVKKRLESEYGMSFTEFSYQLVQGYDFYWLYSQKGCKLQMGGSDQWGNIVTGTELIRRKAGGEAFAFTCPLMTKSDGGKFGKTEKGNVWLDPQKTSPFQFYQFWVNAADADAEKWIRIFTFLSQDEIEKLIEKHYQDPGSRLLQKTLAKEVTILVHGESEWKKAQEQTEKLFSQKSDPAELMSEEDLNSLEGVVHAKFSSVKLMQGIDIVSFLAEAGILSSKGEARKMVQQGGINLNKRRIEDIQFSLDPSLLLHSKYILVQKGKKNYVLVTVS